MHLRLIINAQKKTKVEIKQRFDRGVIFREIFVIYSNNIRSVIYLTYKTMDDFTQNKSYKL